MAVSTAAWLYDFRRLHEQAKAGALAPSALRSYREACDELASALLRTQRLARDPTVAPRRALPVARMLQADLELRDGALRVGTRTISARGFTALLARPPRGGERARVTLRLPGGQALQAAARVLDATPRLGSALVTFHWEDLSAEDDARLESLVFDTALEQLQR